MAVAHALSCDPNFKLVKGAQETLLTKLSNSAQFLIIGQDKILLIIGNDFYTSPITICGITR